MLTNCEHLRFSAPDGSAREAVLERGVLADGPEPARGDGRPVEALRAGLAGGLEGRQPSRAARGPTVPIEIVLVVNSTTIFSTVTIQ